MDGRGKHRSEGGHSYYSSSDFSMKAFFSTLLNFQADNILKDEKIDRQRAAVLSKFGDHTHKFTRT